MEDKIKFEYCFFKTALGKFLLLNTEKRDDRVELINNIIYIKRIDRLFESAIKIANTEKFQYLGSLTDIDHQDIFQNVLRYDLAEYKRDKSYLWRSLDQILNTRNTTILETSNGKFVKFENPHLFKVFVATS